MPILTWDANGSDRKYETGVSKGVLYVMKPDGTYENGVAWNGLSQITEKPTGGDITKIYADNIQYLTLQAAEEFEATIEAYTYPDEFAKCDGSAALDTTGAINITQQARSKFAICYRTEVANDNATPGAEGSSYKLHIIYGCLATPSEKSYQTINDSPEANTFSWDVTASPVPVTGHKPTYHVEIDSAKAGAKITAIEEALYGGDGADKKPTLKTPDELKTLLA